MVAFHDDAWVAQIGNGLTTLTVAVQPAVIAAQSADSGFPRLAGTEGGSPAEVALRNKLKILA